MGLFGKKEICCICNQNKGFKYLTNGMICKTCMEKCGPFLASLNIKNSSPDKICEAISANAINQERAAIFKTTKSVPNYIEIDEVNKLLHIFQYFLSYDEIVDYELLQNGESISKGGLESAIIGGALLGGVGAIVGSNVGKKKITQEISEYRIKITTKNPFVTSLYIHFLTAGKVKSNSFLFKTYCNDANNVLSLLSLVTHEVENSKFSNSISGADEILKYKKLFDAGIITQEEFNTKKTQLLNS